MRVLFPAPEGPMMPVSSPDLNFPFTHFNIVLYPLFLPSDTEYDKSMNWMSTDGLLGKCVSDIVGFFWLLGLLLSTFLKVPALVIVTDEDPLQRFV